MLWIFAIKDVYANQFVGKDVAILSCRQTVFMHEIALILNNWIREKAGIKWFNLSVYKKDASTFIGSNSTKCLKR